MMIEPIFPVDGISEPWAQIFDELTNRWVLESVRDMELDAERALSICHRVHSLHWVVKLRFHSMHQIPFCVSREEENTYKALGYLYVSALKLCEIVTQSELEASRCFFVLVVEGDIERPQIPLNKKNRAALALSMLSNENQELGDGRNPFSIEVSPGTHHLINAAKSMASENQNASDLWDEFLTARKSWVNTAKNEPVWQGLTKNDEGKLRLQLPGRGRATQPIRFDLSQPRKDAFAQWASNELIQPSIPLGMSSAPADTIFNIDRVLQNPIGLACLTLLGQKVSWEGTATEFLSAINQIKGNQNWGDDWPTTPEGLGKKWNELTPKLNRVGIKVSRNRAGKSGKRIIRLSRLTGQ